MSVLLVFVLLDLLLSLWYPFLYLFDKVVSESTHVALLRLCALLAIFEGLPSFLRDLDVTCEVLWSDQTDVVCRSTALVLRVNMLQAYLVD